MSDIEQVNQQKDECFGKQKEFRKKQFQKFPFFSTKKAKKSQQIILSIPDIVYNQQMHFTPYQYRKVEQQFLQQFELRSLEFYDQNINTQSLIQYKKLINLMQSNRKQTLKKKERLRIIKDKYSFTQFDPVISQLRQKGKNDNAQGEDDYQNGFYITQNLQPTRKIPIQLQKNSNIALLQTKSISSRIHQSSSNIQSKIFGSQTNQNLNLDSIYDRIYTQYNVLQSLSHQQSQVQEAIFCFKRRISDLQQQLSVHNMKSKEVERLFVQNNNEMMHVKYTNQEVKSAFLKTKKHFNLDLQGRKQIQQKCLQINKNNFQQSIINHIYLQKMRQKISQQDEQLIELYQKKEQLDSKQKKYRMIYEKEQQFLKTYESIMKINPNDFVKDKIVSILDKEFDEFQEHNLKKQSLNSQKSTRKFNLKTKNSFNLLNQSHNEEEPLTKIVSSLIDLYKRMKHQSIQKAKEYKILISEKDEKEKQLSKTSQKANQVYDCFQHQTQPKSLEDKTQLIKLIKKSNQIQQKCLLTNMITINIEQKISFWLSKHLILIETIMKSFLRHDKNSIKFLQNLLKKTFEVPRLFKFLKNTTSQENSLFKERELHIQDSRNLLINTFENWQNYIEYLNILHESKYIQNFLSQKKLLRFFKRIIKTKLANKQIATQMIFEKAIRNIFEESKQYHLDKIRKLLGIFKELHGYIQKVKNGQAKIHCSINYDSFQKIQEPTFKQQISKNPSQKQLIRRSNSQSKNSLNQKTLTFQPNSLIKTQNNFHQQQQIFHTFSSTQKHLQPNNTNQINLMSKLKKRKQSGSVLNIHKFYQEMREQMKKVHKMSIS